MSRDEHDQLVHEVFVLVRKQMTMDGQLDFTVFTINEQGQKARLAVDPACFQNDGRKNELREKLLAEFRSKGVVRYAVAAECWLARTKPKIAEETLEDYAARCFEEYAEQGY